MIETFAAMLETVWSTPNLRLYLVLLWLLYLIPLGIWIVLQKREPVATLSWLMALALLPYVGFLIYFLLGPQKITRQRLVKLAVVRPTTPSTDEYYEFDSCWR